MRGLCSHTCRCAHGHKQATMTGAGGGKGHSGQGRCLTGPRGHRQRLPQSPVSAGAPERVSSDGRDHRMRPLGIGAPTDPPSQTQLRTQAVRGQCQALTCRKGREAWESQGQAEGWSPRVRGPASGNARATSVPGAQSREPPMWGHRPEPRGLGWGCPAPPPISVLSSASRNSTQGISGCSKQERTGWRGTGGLAMTRPVEGGCLASEELLVEVGAPVPWAGATEGSRCQRR